ncbi:MAG: Lrp/AsnC family transcriptional regulator [Solirubrobacterales bacterium]
MAFPQTRMRRLRRTAGLRSLVREERLDPAGLVLPLFVAEGISAPEPVQAMPGVVRHPVDGAVEEAREAAALGIGGVILFGIPASRDAEGSGAWARDGIVQQALGELVAADTGLVLIADTCLCEYTDHGHCGPLDATGADVPLSDRDRELLNLMQGSFPIAERPYAEVAAELGVTEEEVLADVQRLLDDRIIRQVTPIYDTRAFGYGSMLVAAKVDPEHPWRAAKIVNSHPGVSHNYLRNHDFNMWFTIAVEEDSKLGLQGTLDVLQEKTGAESIRQLPTLKLFKIRMDLEMQGDTDSLASQGKVEEAVELERQSYDQFDRDVVVATQGNLPVVPEPWAPAAEQLGIPVDDLLAHLRGMQERGLLRRVAGILFHRRAGFSANGMGVWRVPEDQIEEIGPQMAAFRGISHCYQRPTYEDWPYQVFTMAHGRSKEECDAILDTIAARFPIEDRATLYSSTEFKKVRLLYFTDDFRNWENEYAGV